MLRKMRRHDATLKRELDINWLTEQDPKVIEAADNATNPTQCKRIAFQSGLSARNVRNALRLATFKRDCPQEYDRLMREYIAIRGGAAL